jgi:hypothetical protein
MSDQMIGRVYHLKGAFAVQVEVTRLVDNASLPVTLVEWVDTYDQSIGMMDLESFNDLFAEVKY